MRTYGPYGREEGITFELPAIGGQIVGFHGRSGRYLDSLGIHIKVCKIINADKRPFFFFFLISEIHVKFS